MNSLLRGGLGVCLALVTIVAQAAPDVPRLQAPADVRVIVDISGSMKQNDPDNLRQPAIRLLARMLPEGSTAGVWTFGEYVNMLVPHGKVDKAWRDLAIKQSSKINSVALRTNLGRAMKVASDTFYSGGDLSHTHFILLTDGKVDISADEAVNEAERKRVLGEVLDRYKKLGATIHTVALSDQADLDFLTTLATRTGGSEAIAKSADELNLAFLHALNAAVPQEQIPIRDNGFLVDSGVSEFTVLVFPGKTDTPLALKDPDGNPMTFDQHPDGVRWVHESSYDLITVDGPTAGGWTIDGTLGAGSRVTVVSDLKMVVSPLPAQFYRGDSVDVAATFYDGKNRITDPDFLSVITVSLSLTTQDGRSGTKVLSGDKPPADGVYRDQISKLTEPGDYTIRLVADG
ncbi:MAG: vWA domain-containing protein, partial [Marinobacter sp.]|nr:vWA domain-containing protein [Marinobacter sp.]